MEQKRTMTSFRLTKEELTKLKMYCLDNQTSIQELLYKFVLSLIEK